MGRMRKDTRSKMSWMMTTLLLCWSSSSSGAMWTNRNDHFTDAIPQLDNDDYTSDNPFERPCNEAKRGLDLPCTCSSGPDNGTYINCDGMVFPGDFPVLPFRYRIHGFSQRMTSYQAFPAQLFTASDIPLKRLDLSQNGVVLITEKLLDGIGDTLEEINLSRNLLGDQLNPIFSTTEFQHLKQLKRLDLSDNGLRAVDDAIIRGCDKLQVNTIFLFCTPGFPLFSDLLLIEWKHENENRWNKNESSPCIVLCSSFLFSIYCSFV